MIRPLLLTLAIAIGAIASRILARHTPIQFHIDRLQPIPIATNWGGFGALTLCLLLVMLACAFIPYALMLRRPPRIRVTLVTVIAALLCGAWFTPLFSSDIYAYAAYGEMARIGLNPYAHGVLPSHDSIFVAAKWQWPELPICVYGEAFVALARGVVSLLAGTSVLLALDGLRAMAFVALVTIVALCAVIDPDRDRGRFAAVFIGCNPIVIWSAIEGHNDAIAIALAFAAIVLTRRSAATAIVVAACAAAVKLPAAFVAASLTIRAFARRASAASICALAALAVLAAAYFRWFEGVRTFVAPRGHFTPLASIAALPWSAAMAIAPANGSLVTAASLLCVALVSIAFAVRARNYRGMDLFVALALAVWILIPNPYPWYSVWLVTLAAFAREPALRRCTLGVGVVALLRYAPDAVAIPTLGPNAAMGLIAIVPYLATLAHRKRAIITGSP